MSRGGAHLTSPTVRKPVGLDYRCGGLEIVDAEQALHVKGAAEPGILQRVDDHRCATPCRGGGVDQLSCCHGLATGVDPVVDEQRPGGGGQQVTPQAELQVPVLIVRRSPRRQPSLTVR
jgi:hypothetical protein